MDTGSYIGIIIWALLKSSCLDPCPFAHQIIILTGAQNNNNKTCSALRIILEDLSYMGFL